MSDSLNSLVQAYQQVQGTLTGYNPRDAVLHGNYLYVVGTAPGTATGGVFIFDATKAFDGNTATVITNADLLSSFLLQNATTVDVHGSYGGASTELWNAVDPVAYKALGSRNGGEIPGDY